MDAENPPAAAAPASFLGKFTVVFGAVRELWIVFAYVVISNLAYRLVEFTLSLWLSSDLGYSDVKAGWWVTIWSAGMTFCIVLVGSLTDALGLRKTFLLGFALCIMPRAVHDLRGGQGAWRWAACSFWRWAKAMGAPVTVAALRRYTTTAQRSIAFSLFYAIMNVGFGLAGYVFDSLRAGLGETGRLALPGLGVELSTYRTIFLVSLLFYVPACCSSISGCGRASRRPITGWTLPQTSPSIPRRACQAFGLTVRDTLRATGRIFMGLWRQPGFYKFLAFLSLAAFIKMIFLHMDLHLSEVRHSRTGRWGADWASLGNEQHPDRLPGPAGRRVDPEDSRLPHGDLRELRCGFLRVHHGGAAPLVSAAGGRLARPLIAHVWLGVKGQVNPYYVMIFLFVLFLSMGEAFYSPRLYEYAAAIAPKGQEASYMAMSSLPFFLAKLCVAPSPACCWPISARRHGPRHSGTLWLIIGLSTMVAPVGLFVFQRFIRVHEAGRDE